MYSEDPSTWNYIRSKLLLLWHPKAKKRRFQRLRGRLSHSSLTSQVKERNDATDNTSYVTVPVCSLLLVLVPLAFSLSLSLIFQLSSLHLPSDRRGVTPLTESKFVSLLSFLFISLATADTEPRKHPRVVE